MAYFLLFAPLARAGQGEDIPIDTLPRKAADALKVVFPGAELLHARKEIEDGKECYDVTVMDKGRERDYFVSRAGHVFTKQAFSFTVLPKRLAGYILLSLLPGAVAGTIVRWLIQVIMVNHLSIISEWLAVWIGAVMSIGIVLSQLSTVPREKDVVVFGLICIVCGGISASVITAVALISQSLRGLRLGYRQWILGCCILGGVFLCLVVPVEMLRVERENEYYKAQAMELPYG